MAETNSECAGPTAEIAKDPDCLQCGQKRSQVRVESLFCCTISGGEQPEVDQEWEHHRWADWTDAELAGQGVKPEAFDRHRRTDASTFQWIACEDQVRGHVYPSERDVVEFEWLSTAQCWTCGQHR